MNYTFQVENIKCHGCMNSIKTALLKIGGVEEVTFDNDKQTVSINGTADKQILLQKLSSLGYPEKGNNTFLKKASSYVSCAIGRIKES